MGPYYPRTDLSTDTEGMLIEMAIPGLSIEDIILELVDNNIVVSGVHKERNLHARYLSKELYTGNFHRKFSINTKIYDVTSIVSKVVNGFLTIRIPFKVVNKTDRIRTLDIQEVKNGSK